MVFFRQLLVFTKEIDSYTTFMIYRYHINVLKVNTTVYNYSSVIEKKKSISNSSAPYLQVRYKFWDIIETRNMKTNCNADIHINGLHKKVRSIFFSEKTLYTSNSVP